MDPPARIDSLLVRDLRALLALAERRHFAQAAEDLGISQPALSAVIKKLEVAFDARLFDRTSRRCDVTPEGEQIIVRVRAVLDEVHHLSGALSSSGPVLTSRFRLGIIPTLAPYYVPTFLSELCRRYPSLELVLVEAKTDILVSLLRAREVDAGLLALPIGIAGMDEAPLFREPFVLAAPEGHELARRSAVTVSDIDLDELLILEAGNCLSDQTLNACGARRAEDVRPIHAASVETLRFMVAAGLGCALLPKLAAPAQTDPRLAICYVPFRSPGPHRTVGLVHRRQSAVRQDTNALVRFLKSRVPSHVEGL